jgi:two-component system phosphate regulon sensor histidine kinase PhoR
VRLPSRFTLVFGVLSAAAAVALILLLEGNVRRAVEDRVTDRLERELDHFADVVGHADLSDERALDDLLRRGAEQLSLRLTLIAPDGRVLYETGLSRADVRTIENHGGREEVVVARANGRATARRWSATTKTEMIYSARRLPDGEVLRAAVSANHIREIEQRHLWPMRLSVGAVCLLLFLIGAAASRRFTSPIAGLTRAASAVAAGDFARDLPTSGGEEVRMLGGALQRMKVSLRSAFERAEGERRLTAMVFETLPAASSVDWLRIWSQGGFGVTGCRRRRESTGSSRASHDCFEATVRGGPRRSPHGQRLADLVAPLRRAPAAPSAY